MSEHQWEDPIVIYECARCHVLRIEPMTDEQSKTMRDGLPGVAKRSISEVDHLWDGKSPCPGP